MASNFSLKIEFIGGLSVTQQAAFTEARDRWREIIVGALPPVMVDGQQIDGLVIEAQGIFIDGSGGILGQAGPTILRNDSNLPVKGLMSFDTGDLAQMEADGSLRDVILHEMGHVLGLGTLWSSHFFDFVKDSGSDDPLYTGHHACHEYAVLLGNEHDTDIPLANTGGPGTREGHWRELTFAHELMTGFISGVSRPLSRMTIAALQDMGYEVDYSSADPYSIPDSGLLAMLSLSAPSLPCCRVTRPKPVYLADLEQES
ncbi:MAG: leishmanolysin [Cohaesibacter sp.]|nr:leishmanolysin [Cohaesibacter sp.]MCV6602818.1 leishmanolysin [Cohaesibacter sp.]